ALVVASAGLQIAGAHVPVIGAGWVELDPERWPVGLLDAIHAHEPPPGDPPAHIFNEDQFGGFLILNAPRYRVFFDDRFELYGGQMVKDFVTAGGDSTASYIANWQTKYGGFDAALVHAGGGFDEYF